MFLQLRLRSDSVSDSFASKINIVGTENFHDIIEIYKEDLIYCKLLFNRISDVFN